MVVHLFFFISENKYGKFNLTDRYNPIYPSNPTHNKFYKYVKNIRLDILR